VTPPRIVLWLVALSACSSSGAAGGNPPPFARDSGFDYALVFNGTSDYVTAGNAQFPDGRSPQTLSLWFNAKDVVTQQAMLTLRKDFDSGVELGVRNGTVGAWRVYGGGDLATAPITANAWHHVAYTFDGTTNAVYVDGAPAGSSLTLPDKRTPTTTWFGTLDGSRDLYSGSLDDVRVRAVLQTPADIASEAQGTFSPSEPGVVGAFTFDESGGDRAFDRSALGNDATLGDGIPDNMPARAPSSSPVAPN
jgi:hypothetical protein